MLDYILSKSGIILLAFLLFVAFIAIEKNLELFFLQREAINICENLITEVKYVSESPTLEEKTSIELPHKITIGFSNYKYSLKGLTKKEGSNTWIIFAILYKNKIIYACGYLHKGKANVNFDVEVEEKPYIIITKDKDLITVKPSNTPT